MPSRRRTNPWRLFTEPAAQSLQVLAVAVAMFAAGNACSATGSTKLGGRAAGGSGGIVPGSGGAAGGAISIGGSAPIGLDSGIPTGPCTQGGWTCAIDACDGMPKTSVRAKVYDPAGLVPLYNVAVYVPNAELLPIADGATCETCATPVSGSPIASALTNSQGEFTMLDVPVGSQVPLVIQIGKWRRQIAMPAVKRCQENVFDDPQTFRLPRNQNEGHIPKIAMSSGEADSLECLLRRIGVADSEFTNPTGPGRVNLFADEGSASSYAAGGTYPIADPNLWGSLDTLKAYDIVLMSCPGSQSQGRIHTTLQKQAIKDYVDGGGRLFLEHYHYSWLRGMNEDPVIEDARKYTPTPFPPVALWATAADPNVDNGNPSATNYQIDTSFPKGNDFADWLVNVGASTTKGTISLVDVKHPALDVLPVSQRWIFNATPQSVPYLTVNTPIEKLPEEQCGRLVHTGVHVAIAANDQTTSPFPSGCRSAALTPQEKAMEFLLFDLSSCVMNNRDPPVPPVIPK